MTKPFSAATSGSTWEYNGRRTPLTDLIFLHHMSGALT